MVPMRLDAYDTRLPVKTLPVRPILVLKDITKNGVEEPRRSVRVRCSAWSRLENIVIAAALATALVFFAATSVLSLVQTIRTRYGISSLPSVVTISQTVARGDTLAKFAARYGNPNTYILKREDQIARANHLSGAAPLVPGQRLQIPVTNPIVIAQIVRTSQYRQVASR